MKMKNGIIGAGGFGREVFASMSKLEQRNTVFFVDDAYFNGGDNILPLSKFDPIEYKIIIAIGDPKHRRDLVNRLPKETVYFTYIHPSVQILGNDVEIGDGSIICAGSILTTNIKLGKHTHLNLHTTIGHDCIIGDFFTTAPGAKVSGNCTIENCVYVGTNASIKEKITICSNVTIGLSTGVVKNIEEPGIYVGTPAYKLNKYK